jgi:hypothetical protein
MDKDVTTYTDRLCVCCGETTPWPLRGMNVAPRCADCRRWCNQARSEPCKNGSRNGELGAGEAGGLAEA